MKNKKKELKKINALIKKADLAPSHESEQNSMIESEPVFLPSAKKSKRECKKLANHISDSFQKISELSDSISVENEQEKQEEVTKKQKTSKKKVNV